MDFKEEYGEKRKPDADEEDYFIGVKGLERKAKRDGLNIILPGPNELFIDIDSEEEYQQFQEKMKWFRDVMPEQYGMYLSIVKEMPSKSGLPRRHITVYVEFPEDHDLNPWERICLQFCLGSDFKRERLSTCRMLIGEEEYATAFLEKKEE
jgi:hypothetical protein